jgi:two-component system phosphate regulon sensor histidine kinase PhoR
MKGSIFLRIFLGHALVAVALAAIVVVFSFRAIREHHLATLTADLEDLARTLEIEVAPMVEQHRHKDLDSLVKDLGKTIGTRITIIDPAGNVLADSEGDPELMESHRTRPELMKALTGRVGTARRFSTTVEQEMLYVAIPIEQDTIIIGALRVSLFLSEIEELISDLRKSIARAAAIAIGISLAAALIISGGLSRPIRDLHIASRRVAEGDFDVKVLLKGSEELRALADSFNHMTDRIKTLIADLSEKGEELSGVVSSMQDGLMVLDRDGRIILANDSLRDIAGETDVEARPYWELIRSPQLDDIVKKVMEQRAHGTGEVRLGERTYVCNGAFQASQEGAVVLFHDMTEIKSLEKVKKDFIVNLSHELRTPLTAIKGFLETLEDEVSEEGRRYLQIVRRHTDRLADIVDDLLQLSSLEDGETRLELSRVDLKAMIESVARIFEQKAHQKGLTIKMRTGEGTPTIEADHFKIEQVFVNLIANAVKYTEEGGIEVSVAASDSDVVITVADTGIGIPQEHIQRIFERFYVVDKSRSKRVGGTGLGLSIVKHIVLLHNGTVDVESEVGKGSKFVVTLPTHQS